MRARAPAVIMAAAALAAAMAGCAGPRAAPAGGPARGGPGRAAAASPGSSGLPTASGRVITVRAADGVPLATIEAGAGDRAVVLIPELGQRGKCGWWAFAAYLAAHGYHVLAFDHRCTGGSSCPAGAAAEADLMSDIRGAAAWLRQHGAIRVALVGASQGGSEALIAATMPAPGITGVAAGDPYVSVPDTRSLLARAGSPGKRLVVLAAGAGHGWDLVTPLFPGGAPSALSGTVLAFLRSVTA
jgi:pimeloyl-ACP methyl ester carboxylesterase